MAHTSEKKTENTAETTEKAAKRSSWLWWLVLIVALGGSWLWYQMQWDARINEARTPASSKAETTQRKPSATNKPVKNNAKLERQLEQLNRTMEKAFSQIESVSERVDALSGQMQTTAETTQEPKSVPAQAEPQPAPPSVDSALLMNMQSQLDALSRQLETLQTQQKESQTQHANTLEALQLLQTLETHLHNGEPFAETLEILGDLPVLPQNAPAMQTLQQHAVDGIPTLAELSDAFRKTANMVVPVVLGSRNDATLADRLRARVGHVISIRKTDAGMEDTSDEALLARAENLLEQGDVQGALAQLKLTSDKSRTLFTDTRQKMEAYANSWQALHNLHNRLLTPVDGGQG